MVGISYQFYCSRDHGIAETFAMLEEAGYNAIEGYGPLYEDPAATKALMDKHGMTMPTAHVSIDLAEDTDKVIAVAKALGIERIIVPWIAPEARGTTTAEWTAFAQRLAKAGKPIVEAGFKFGWHNHDFEFFPTAEGDMPLDIIMAAGDHISLELDLGWTFRAGQDCVAWINKYADRLIAVHVKDRAAEGENKENDGWADVGYGIIDWKSIKTALDAAGVDRYVIENDHPGDHKRFATRSLASVKAF